MSRVDEVTIASHVLGNCGWILPLAQSKRLHHACLHTLDKKNCKEEPPAPTLGSKLPRPAPTLRSHLKKIFFGVFGAHVLCVPRGHVQGVSQLFTLNSMAL